MDKRGRTPLHIACGMGNKGAVKSIIANVEAAGSLSHLLFFTLFLFSFSELFPRIFSSLSHSLTLPSGSDSLYNLLWNEDECGRIWAHYLCFLPGVYKDLNVYSFTPPLIAPFGVHLRSLFLSLSQTLNLFHLRSGLTAPHHKESLLLCCGADGLDVEIGNDVLDIFRGLSLPSSLPPSLPPSFLLSTFHFKCTFSMDLYLHLPLLSILPISAKDRVDMLIYLRSLSDVNGRKSLLTPDRYGNTFLHVASLRYPSHCTPFLSLSLSSSLPLGKYLLILSLSLSSSLLPVLRVSLPSSGEEKESLLTWDDIASHWFNK